MSCTNGGTHINQTFILTGITDVFVTGGTLTNGTATFTNNSGGTFTVTGFTNPDLNITGGTTDNSNKTYIFNNNTGGTFTVIGLTDITVTGGTYTAGTATFTNNTGGTFSVTGFSTGSSSSLSISTNVIPKGSGSTITNGTWAFSGTTLYPLTDVSNIGLSGTNRVSTIYLASTLDYANNLVFKSGGTETLRIGGKYLGLNSSGSTAYLSIGNDDTPPFSSSTISTGNNPISAAKCTSNNTIYIANGGSGTISVLNSNNVVITTINLGGIFTPDLIVYDSSHNRMYFTDASNNTITPINCVNNSVGTDIQLSNYTSDLAFNTINNVIYTITSSGDVERINTNTNTVTGTTISVGSDGYGIAFNPVNNSMYVNSYQTGVVSVINCVTNIVTTAITTSVVNATGIAYNSINNCMYMVGHGSAVVINCNTNTVTGSSISIGNDSLTIGFDPVNNRMYVANLTIPLLSIIDCTTNSIIKNYGLPVSSSISHICYDNVNQRMYLPEPNLNYVLPISTYVNPSIASLQIKGFGTFSADTALSIVDRDDNSILKVRNDRKLIYTDGNEGNGKVLMSNATGIATWTTPTSITGGSFTNSTLTLTNNSGGTFNTLIRSFSALTATSITATTVTATTVSAATVSATSVTGITVSALTANITNLTLRDTTLNIQNTTTPSKKLQFSASAITASNTITLVSPNRSGTIGLSGSTTIRSVAGPLTSDNTTPKMLGLSGTVTPISSGKVLVSVTWDQSADSGGFVISVSLRLGTGSAPVNGAAPTGTQFGSTRSAAIPLISSVCFIATGLTVGTTYWIDLAMQADNGFFGTGSITNIDIAATELS